MTDPARLHGLAAALLRHAERVRALLPRVVGCAEVGWRSSAAELFRDRVDRAAVHLHRTSRALEAAAADVEAHARAVDTVLAEVERAARAVAGEVDSVVRSVVRERGP